jgi:phosphodiesterase/alkaline phosphatase D-like protein
VGRRSARGQAHLLVLVFAFSGLCSAVLAPVIPASAASNPIVAENQQTGTNAWQIGALVADDTNGQIKGYASLTSVSQGQSISLYVSVNPAQTYTIDFFRVGWYGGLGGRLRLHAGPLSGAKRATCAPNASTGLIACNWPVSYTLTIPTDWTSGVYLGLLTNAQGYQNYVMFVVRDGRPAPFLYQQSVTTDQAYNNYPDDSRTGKSLYTYNSYGPPTASGDARAVKVSFDRPYTYDGSGFFRDWEIDFIRWMERSGYDVTYSTDVDTHANGTELRNHRAFLSVGHDEYWSKEMYDAAAAARDGGVNLAFFGADAVGWQIRFESSAGGTPNRVIVCYKLASIDPVQGPTTTVEWQDVGRPEQTLLGVQFASNITWGTSFAYRITNSANWVYAGSGFTDGATVPGILGYEMDQYYTTYPAPPGTNRVLLSDSPFTDVAGTALRANSSIYQAPSGAWVFAAGTMSWSWALDNYDHTLADARIQRATANLFDRFLSAGTPPALQISAVQATSVGPATATISWTTTNPASSRVDYGPTTGYGTVATDGASVTSHSLVLSGLSPSTTYHYRVTSVDAYTQTASSVDAVLTTTAIPALQLSAIQAGGVNVSSAVIGWTTNNAANSRVDYGTTTTYGSAAIDPSSTTAHSLTLSGLTPSTTYHYLVTSVDVYGQTAAGADAAFTTSAVPPLQISAVQATSITSASATITWTTSNAAGSHVDYGPTIPYPSSATGAGNVTGHSVALSGLSASTTYHYRVTSTDTYAQSASSPDATFTTPSAAPNLVANPGFESGATGWSLDPPAAIDTTAANAHSGTHSLKIATTTPWQGAWANVAVTPGNTYTFGGWERSATGGGYLSVFSFSASWAQLDQGTNLVFPGTGAWTSLSGTYVPVAGTAWAIVGAQSSVAGTFWFDDISVTGAPPPPLQISAVQAGSIGPTSALITWTTSNASNSRVDYGTTASYGTVATSASSVTAHSVTLAGLAPSTTYHFKVTSVDGSNQTASGADTTFTTIAPPALQLSAVQATGVGTTTATVTWTTNTASTSRVDYGATTAYGTVASNASSVTAHSLSLSGLTAATTYHFSVTSVDGFNQTAASPDASFTTTTVSANLVVNPGFESGATGWSLASTASIDATAANAHSGTRSLKLVATAGWQGTWQNVPLTPGKTYTFSAWVRSTTSSGYLSIYSEDASYTLLDQGTHLVYAGTGAWTYLSGTFVPVAGTTQALIGVSNSAAGTFWFDDISIVGP